MLSERPQRFGQHVGVELDPFPGTGGFGLSVRWGRRFRVRDRSAILPKNTSGSNSMPHLDSQLNAVRGRSRPRGNRKPLCRTHRAQAPRRSRVAVAWGGWSDPCISPVIDSLMSVYYERCGKDARDRRKYPRHRQKEQQVDLPADLSPAPRHEQVQLKGSQPGREHSATNPKPTRYPTGTTPSPPPDSAQYAGQISRNQRGQQDASEGVHCANVTVCAPALSRGSRLAACSGSVHNSRSHTYSTCNQDRSFFGASSPPSMTPENGDYFIIAAQGCLPISRVHRSRQALSAVERNAQRGPANDSSRIHLRLVCQ
jgi:hypothetical protein